MKGLLLKDIINLKQQGKIYLLMLGIWMAIGFVNKNGDYFGGIMMMLTVVVPISAIAYDEKAKWDRYALTMPVSRKDIVLSKYILAAVCAVVGAFLSEIVSVIITKKPMESLMTSLLYFSLGLIFASIVLPVIFKFGVEQGRLLMLAVILVPTALTMTLSKAGVPLPSEETVQRAVTFSPAAAVLLIILSAIVSTRIYRRKEF